MSLSNENGLLFESIVLICLHLCQWQCSNQLWFLVTPNIKCIWVYECLLLKHVILMSVTLKWNWICEEIHHGNIKFHEMVISLCLDNWHGWKKSGILRSSLEVVAFWGKCGPKRVKIVKNFSCFLRCKPTFFSSSESWHEVRCIYKHRLSLAFLKYG